MNIKVSKLVLGIRSGSTERQTVMQTEKNTAPKRILTYQWWKNVFDPVIAFLFLVFALPLFIIIAVMIRIDSRGKIIYCREQVGKNGKIFTMYKFRTMTENNDDSEYKSYIVKYITKDAPYTTDENGQAIYKVINDPRVTKIGAWLRKSNLDELPQFINILKGDMSLIGPRPDVPFAVDMYQDWHRERLLIKPGLIGLWQVSRRKNTSFEDMVRLDIDYIKRQSLIQDIKIIIKTIGIVLSGDGS